MATSRRASSGARQKPKTARTPRRGRTQAQKTGRDTPPPAVAEHPGVLAAHPGPVTEAECEHPAGRRDPKNPGFCRACGTGGHTPPARRR